MTGGRVAGIAWVIGAIIAVGWSAAQQWALRSDGVGYGFPPIESVADAP
ncbi:MAG: hypothetical protein ABMB14_32250 [Myxococcota bacterium]